MTADCKVDQPIGGKSSKVTRAKLGQQAESLFVRRSVQVRNGKIKRTVPEMVYGISSGADSAAVPRHQLLEDDWRAFRNVLNIHLRLNRRAHEAGNPQEAALQAYHDVAQIPKGYYYQRFRQAKKAADAKRVNAEEWEGEMDDRSLPVVVIGGPLDLMYHVPDHMRHGPRLRDALSTNSGIDDLSSQDPTRLSTGAHPESVVIYNEPDVVPDRVIDVNLSKPLDTRVLNLVGQSKPFVSPMPKQGFPSFRRPKEETVEEAAITAATQAVVSQVVQGAARIVYGSGGTKRRSSAASALPSVWY